MGIAAVRNAESLKLQQQPIDRVFFKDHIPNNPLVVFVLKQSPSPDTARLYRRLADNRSMAVLESTE